MDTKSQERERKKAEFSEPSRRKSKSHLSLVAVLVGLAGVGVYLVISASNAHPAATAVATNAPSNSPDSHDIRVSLSELSGTAKFFDYKLSDNKPIRFFVIKSSDGVYRAALDACDTCYHAKKGYHQEGDDMICNNCGLHFHSAQINEVQAVAIRLGFPGPSREISL